MNEHDPLCLIRECERVCGDYPDCTHFCTCNLIAKARADERARTLDDVAASVRAYFRQHGWEASDHGLIEWLDNNITERKDTP